MSLYHTIWPALAVLDPETAHRSAIGALKLGAARLFSPQRPDHPCLRTTVWSRTFPNPVGLAAGFDKNAEVVGPVASLGFGFVEVGGVTPLPQPGNPRPRMFRLTEDRAVINRLGFNSDGLATVQARLQELRLSGMPCILGVNIGKNKESTDAVQDYVTCVQSLAPLSDFLVINVSSPNTPGLRALQNVESLVALTRAVRHARERVGANVPLLFKIAPDLAVSDVSDICRVAMSEKMDGMVVSNTTISRPDALKSSFKNELGGLSGAPLFERSTQMLREVYALTEGKLPLVGVGGISSAEQAYTKIRAGASLVQLYSALVYEGPGLVRKITAGLAALLQRDGFSHVAEAVGADHRAGTRS
jgi:dihydroorotate dehydrogenase